MSEGPWHRCDKCPAVCNTHAELLAHVCKPNAISLPLDDISTSDLAEYLTQRLMGSRSHPLTKRLDDLQSWQVAELIGTRLAAEQSVSDETCGYVYTNTGTVLDGTVCGNSADGYQHSSLYNDYVESHEFKPIVQAEGRVFEIDHALAEVYNRAFDTSTAKIHGDNDLTWEMHGLAAVFDKLGLPYKIIPEGSRNEGAADA